MDSGARYRLTRRLGQGGMAEVLEGFAEGEAGFRRRVAVKRILPELASDPSVARMFLDEARIASQLHHANIVAVLDYGTADGVPFQVLELVDGLDLDHLLRMSEERGTKLSTGLASYIATQVAYALAHAHSARGDDGAPLGIVHRDVSPSNVLVSWDGHVKLGDFGIALAANRVERTQNDGVKGKLEYMSPEQATRGHVDARTDVFALGCMLHRMLTGKSPLTDLTTLSRVLSGEQLELDATLPSDVADVIRKATRTAQTERYGSAQELARALGELVPRYLPEEPTGALLRFVAALREPEPKPKKAKRGALDALFDVELVLSGDGESRSYTTRRIETTAPAESVPAPPHVPSESTLAPPRSSTHRLRSAALAIAIAIAAAALWMLRATGERSVALVPRASAPAATAQLTAQPHESAQPTPSAPARKAAPEPKPMPREPASKPSHRPTKPRTESSHADAAKPATAPTPSSARGTLVIGGERAHRAEIRIDGRAQGFAPKRLELSTGEHELELVRPDGTRIGPHTVRVEATHTPSSPAKWIVN